MNTLSNKVQLIGNMGGDPRMMEFNGGKKKANFSMATTEFYKNGEGEKVQETQWHNLVAWGKTAEIAEKFLKKGAKVAIEGKLTSRQYETKEGARKYINEVIVNDILLVDVKK
ncbi:MAG: single-stranded DNA-binding protein [Bacteroidales bacterium]|nr:single-stranded DNA-binding protein [Bacteroidales bacterium]